MVEKDFSPYQNTHQKILVTDPLERFTQQRRRRQRRQRAASNNNIKTYNHIIITINNNYT